ncbi:MAG: site-specific integrase [Ignavibacteriales bacterium]|nr:MAG: site-specific integrase [Ignavibacteriales bacterium]
MEVLQGKQVRKSLTLSAVEGSEGLFTGIKSNGKKYSVRKDRHSYFFPDTWIELMNVCNQDQKDFFNGLLISGARIDEWLHCRPKDYSWDRNTLKLFVTKVKAKKKENKILGGASRDFGMSSQYIKRIRAYIKRNNIADDERLFKFTKQNAWQLLRRKLKKIGIEDYWQYSLHNIRKTTGMWLKTIQSRGKDLDSDEICMRLGHDHNTFLKHYGSPSRFTDSDRDKIVNILGDVYGIK